MSRRKKILMLIGIVCGMTVLIPVVRHYQLRGATEAYIAVLKAKGEPMELAQVIPPPIPPEQNNASNFWKAARLINTNQNVLTSNPPPAMRIVAPGKAMVGWKQPEVHSAEGVNSWEEIKQELAKQSEALELLIQLTNNPAFDFELDYAKRFQLLLHHLAPEKKCATLLSAAAISDLHSGDTASAIEDARAILTLVEGTEHERLAISQLVRIAIAQIGLATTWEILQSPNVTEEQLRDLQLDWSQLEFVRAASLVLPVEREGAETNLKQWRSSNAEFEKYLGLGSQVKKTLGLDNEEEEKTSWEQMKMKGRICLWRYWWSYADELRGLKGYEALMTTLRFAETNGSFLSALKVQVETLNRLGISDLTSSFDSIFSGQTNFHAIFSGSIVTLSRFTQKVMRVEVAKQTAIAAIALKR